jgi:RHS repeat-associated protein
MENREITREDYRYGYQGQYSEENKETGWNEFQLRMYDARIGRWLSPDPYGQFASPYLAMGNVPQLGSDPDGGWCCGKRVASATAGRAMPAGATAKATQNTIVLNEIIVHGERTLSLSHVLTQRGISIVSKNVFSNYTLPERRINTSPLTPSDPLAPFFSAS